MKSGAPPYVLQTEKTHSVLVLQPSINDAQWGDIEEFGNQLLNRLKQRPHPFLLLDLTNLDYIGSALVALIVRLWKATDENQGRMIVINHNSTVREVLDIAGLTKVWTIVETREQAIERVEAFRVGAVTRKALSVLWPLAGIAGLTGAGIFLYLTLQSSGIIDQRVAQVLQFGCVALGLIAGSLSASRGAAVWKWIGVALVVASFAIGAAGALNLPPAPGNL